ncbi:MAG: COX15/CtaA family protein [Phycisphaerales bacterium]
MPEPRTLGSGLVWGFATALAMWVVAFLGHMPGVPQAPAIIGVGLLLCQAAGAIATRRARTGLIASLVAGSLNLLALGSVLTDAEADPSGHVTNQDAIPGAAIYILGYLAASTALGVLGGWIGSRLGRPRAFEPLPRFALVAALAVAPLLLVGGLVTGTKSGMAVPDWPSSYSANMFLFPLSMMTGGVFYEHAHRLFGSFVGLTFLTLALWTIAAEPRRWVKFFAAALFALVCVQGYLGGKRVIDNAAAMGVIHGVLGQITFGLAVALAVSMTSAFRSAAQPADGAAAPTRRSITPGLAIAALVTLVIQLSFGALFRQMGSKHALWSHVLFALVPAVLVMVVGFASARGKGGPPVQRLAARLGKALNHSMGLQLLLGGAALWAVIAHPGVDNPAWPRVLIGTAHQFNGAVLVGLLAGVTTLALRMKR